MRQALFKTFLLVCAWLAATSAFAGRIIASGDTTPLASASSPDNSVFFANVLGSGTAVVVHEAASDFLGTELSSYYDSLAGVSSIYHPSLAITDALLSGVDLFVTGLVGGALSASELAALDSFVAGGGTVMIMGDYTYPFDDINAALTGLGSSMQLAGVPTFPGTHLALVQSDPLTAGVSNFSYGFTYGVTGGTPLFREIDSRRVFMAYETINGTPEPGAAGLIGLALLALAASRQRKA